MYEIVSKKNGGDESYVRPDIYVKDDKELLDELIQAKDANMITDIRAVMEYMRINEEQAEKEMEKINKENDEKMEKMALLGNQNGNDDQTQVQ